MADTAESGVCVTGHTISTVSDRNMKVTNVSPMFVSDEAFAEKKKEISQALFRIFEKYMYG